MVRGLKTGPGVFVLGGLCCRRIPQRPRRFRLLVVMLKFSTTRDTLAAICSFSSNCPAKPLPCCTPSSIRQGICRRSFQPKTHTVATASNWIGQPRRQSRTFSIGPVKARARLIRGVVASYPGHLKCWQRRVNGPVVQSVCQVSPCERSSSHGVPKGRPAGRADYAVQRRSGN